MGFSKLSVFALASAAFHGCCHAAGKPNIVMIFTDDQDLHLGSLDYMPAVKSELIEKGTNVMQHYATVAKCCPSRASLFRGQAAHNTNITEVRNPGGDHAKWLVSKENDDYLPFWLVDAGYNAEYIGKFLNGYGLGNYESLPKGWTHVDALLEPYVYQYNNVVMSPNGKTPKAYHGYHQSDVLRAKALDRLDHLTGQDKPFYLTVAPAAPHNIVPHKLPEACKRHANLFEDATVPKTGNWDSTDEQQRRKPSWLKELPVLNSTKVERADAQFRARLRVLQGVDEMVEDIVRKLDDKGVLDNTYIIYTTDNGYHIGNHRVPSGKSLPYKEDTNVPFVVRGPGVPRGRTSQLPGSHVDLAPTFLDIAGVEPGRRPKFLDGRSLRGGWERPETEPPRCPASDAADMINVEYWGTGEVEASWGFNKTRNSQNSYKTLRIVGGESSYLYSKWCTGETELYDTKADPHELDNLAAAGSDQDAQTKRLMSRLNALLLATKSCADQTCRNPWKLLQPEEARRGKVVEDEDDLTIRCLDQALQEKYDAFFESVPQVAFQECMQYQFAPNEEPFWPAGVRLGQDYREPTDNYVSPDNSGRERVKGNAQLQGGLDQRHTTIAEMEKKAKELTKKQLPAGS